MCIACEMALLMALDDLPDEPPPGFPRPRGEQATGFNCDGWDEAKRDTDASPPENERKP